jgi:hypothetical protein
VGASCGSGARSCASLHRDDSGRPKKSALGGEFVGTAGTPSSPLIACSRTSCKRCSIRSIARASGGPRTAPRSKAAATGGDQERTGRSSDALKLLSAFLVNFVRQLGRLTSDRPGDAIGKDLENTAAVSTPWRGWRGRAAVAWVALWVNPGKRRKTLRNQWRVAEKDPLPPALRPRKTVSAPLTRLPRPRCRRKGRARSPGQGCRRKTAGRHGHRRPVPGYRSPVPRWRRANGH